MPGEATRTLLRVTQTLERLGITYAIGGSLASSFYGVMRATLDADIVADLQPEHVEPLVAALAQEFYADAAMMRDAISRQSSFNLIHYESAFKADIFVCKSRGFEQQQLARRRSALLSTEQEEAVYVVSPEDIILAKLEWYRLGGESSDRQWRDILGVFHTRGNVLDQEYLRRWAAALGISDLLTRALREAG